ELHEGHDAIDRGLKVMFGVAPKDLRIDRPRLLLGRCLGGVYRRCLFGLGGVGSGVNDGLGGKVAEVLLRRGLIRHVRSRISFCPLDSAETGHDETGRAVDYEARGRAIFTWKRSRPE